MKKTYQSPMTMIVKVNMKHHLMEPSIQTSANSASVNSETNEYNTLSRDGAFWDDDEE